MNKYLSISRQLIFLTILLPLNAMESPIDKHYSEHCLDNLNGKVKEAIFKELKEGYSHIAFLLNTIIVLRNEALEEYNTVHTNKCTLAFTLRESCTNPSLTIEAPHHAPTSAQALQWLQSNAEKKSLQTSGDDVIFKSFAYEENGTGEEYIINITIPSIPRNPLIYQKMSKYLIPNG